MSAFLGHSVLFRNACIQNMKVEIDSSRDDKAIWILPIGRKRSTPIVKDLLHSTLK